MKGKKRGQITLFIIIGIVLLFIAGTYMYLKSSVSDKRLIERKVGPVQEYIEECMKDITIEGVNIIGLKGGYIDYPIEIRYNPKASLSRGPGIKTPLWYYDGEPNVPPLEDIEQAINTYIEKNLDACINNFEPFKNQFEITEQGARRITTTITDKDIVVEMRSTVKTRNLVDDKETKIKEFFTVVPVRLKMVYELAVEIFNAENRDQFFEKRTLGLISIDREVPFMDMAFQCHREIWLVPRVRQKIKDLLTVNMPFTRFVGTDYEPYPQTHFGPLSGFRSVQTARFFDQGFNFREEELVIEPSEDSHDFTYFENHFVWNFTEKKFPGIKAAVYYDPSWPMELTIRPNDGAILQSGSQQSFDFLSFLCIQTWHFTYDLVYPLQITIIDDAPNYLPFIFNFGFEVSINHNRPDRTEFVSEPGVKQIRRPTSREYCSERAVNLTVMTYDNITREPITDINITMTCARYSCPLGQTEWESTAVSYGSVAKITANVPYCSLAIIKAESDEYATREVLFPVSQPHNVLSMDLVPIKEIRNYKVIKMQADKPYFDIALARDEKAFINIELPGTDFSSYGFFGLETDEPEFNIPLRFLAKKDHTYEVSIYLIKENPSNVEESGMIGGYKGNWTVRWDDLKYADELTLYTVYQSPPPVDELEQFLFIVSIEDYSRSLPKPELE